MTNKHEYVAVYLPDAKELAEFRTLAEAQAYWLNLESEDLDAIFVELQDKIERRKAATIGVEQ